MAPLPILTASMVAPGDLGPDDFLAGRSALARLPEGYPVAIGAPVPLALAAPDDFPHPAVPRPLLLALEALRRLEIEPGRRYGLAIGLSSLHSDPVYVQHVLSNHDRPELMSRVAAYRDDFAVTCLADAVGGVGPRVRIDSACASGSDALILAHLWIEAGVVDDVVVVASSSMLNPLGLALFKNLRALSEEDDLSASRPFDRRRSGFVMGEGAAAVWLSRTETREPLGWLCSYGQSMNAYKMTDMPDDLSAMEAACRAALDGRTDVAYVSAHGTSTPANDRCETRLHKTLFGDRASSIPLSSIKSMTGHCLGPSSLIEVIVTLHALRAGLAPPTLNLEEPEPGFDLDYVPREAHPIVGDFALSNSFAFGGHNSSLLLSRTRPTEALG